MADAIAGQNTAEERKIMMSVKLEIGTIFGVRVILCLQKKADETKNAFRQADDLIKEALSSFKEEKKLKVLSELLPGKDSYYPLEMVGKGTDSEEWLIPSDNLYDPLKVVLTGNSPFYLIRAKALIDEALPSDLYSSDVPFMVKECLSGMNEDCSFSYRIENVPVIESYEERVSATSYMEGGGFSKTEETEKDSDEL